MAMPRQDGYYSYLSYEGMFNPPIIMNGQLYYNIANPPEYGFVDVDLQQDNKSGTKTAQLMGWHKRVQSNSNRAGFLNRTIRNSDSDKNLTTNLPTKPE